MTDSNQAPTPKTGMTRNAKIALAMVFSFMAFGLFGLYRLFTAAPEFDIPTRVTDIESERKAGTLGGPKGGGESIDLAGTFVDYEATTASSSTNWPNFRGHDFSNIVGNEIKLADSWPASGPKELWSVELGEGHAGAAVYSGVVYMLDYDEEKQGDALRTFALDSGKELWRRTYKVTTKRNHGISRTIPAITDKYTVTMGPRCHVLCVDTATGEFRWGIDLVAVYEAEVPLWYTGQCPIIDEGQAILAPGGKVLMMGVDCETGKVAWEVPNPDRWQMSHSSVIPMMLQGKRTFVYCSMGGTYGVSAEAEDRGKLLWSTNAWSHSVISPSPIRIDDRRIFLTAGYGSGSMMLEISRSGETFTAKPLYELDKTVFGCEQQTPILYKDHIYGILPKDSAALKEQFVCMDRDGKIVWTSGKTERFGLGPFLLADDKFYILNDDGEMTMIRASLKKYEQLARHRVVPNGHDAWAPMALVDGKLILRDAHKMVCLDVSAP